eukprot:GEMP01037503.1.p1 GENE.GEMP01037503.1~~GEMP01037503.1.p1  ORF type:complete len:340 (+),score=72.78 GEMP01037503.1:110-1129(+)
MAIRHPNRNRENRMASGPMMVLPLEKKHGQHLLKNPGILDKIVLASDLKPSDIVFEIGPGTGNLTMMLLAQAKTVIAQEIDHRMAAEVKKRAINSGKTNLIVREGDCLRADWPPFHACVANLPYKISSPFTFKLLAHRPVFRCAVIMFQLEFAQRLVAPPGDRSYGRLAINTRLFAKVSTVCTVSRKSFNPPPEVDSMVVKFVPRDPPIEVDFSEWDGMMQVVFGRKRKLLRATFGQKKMVKLLQDNYKTWCALTGTTPTTQPFKEYISDVLQETGLSEERAIKLDLDTYLVLLLAFNKKGIHFANVAKKITKKEAMETAFASAAREEDDDSGDDGMKD